MVGDNKAFSNAVIRVASKIAIFRFHCVVFELHLHLFVVLSPISMLDVAFHFIDGSIFWNYAISFTVEGKLQIFALSIEWIASHFIICNDELFSRVYLNIGAYHQFSVWMPPPPFSFDQIACEWVLRCAFSDVDDGHILSINYNPR